MAHISPYEINNYIQELISELENEFSTDKELIILSKINRIDSYPDMSRYQLSLTQKRLGDCYMKYNITGNALEMYQAALNNNKNLPIKRKIKELLSFRNNLIYSSDVNYIASHDMVVHVTPEVSKEYDVEYEKKLYTALGNLGDEYRESFYDLRAAHDFYSSKQDDAYTTSAINRDFSKKSFFTGLSEEELRNQFQKAMSDTEQYFDENWDEITAKDMAKSKHFQNIHNSALDPARNLILDVTVPVCPDMKNFLFSNHDLMFIKYIHHKPVTLDYIPGYFTHEYHIDYCNVIQVAFLCGLLQYATPSYTLSKMTVADLKHFLSQNDIKITGKKADLINAILTMCDTDSFEKRYYELTTYGIMKVNEITSDNMLLETY